MHVLLTGANGFIGRYIMGALLAAGARRDPRRYEPGCRFQ
jgi:thioester reductase-like protein